MQDPRMGQSYENDSLAGTENELLDQTVLLSTRGPKVQKGRMAGD